MNIFNDNDIFCYLAWHRDSQKVLLRQGVFSTPIATKYLLVGIIVSLILKLLSWSQKVLPKILLYVTKVYPSIFKLFCFICFSFIDKVFNELQAELAEEKRLERIKGRTRLDKLKIYSFRFLVNIIVLGLLAASIFAIIKAVEVSSNPVC